MLNRTCDFCYKRKRQCDGLAQRHCSFCAAKNQAECYYRRRRPRSRLPATSTSHPASSSDCTPGHDDHSTRARRSSSLTGRSFWRTDSDMIAALSGERVLSSASSGGAGDGRVPGLLLPLKRGRFSASPATGLIGLQENEFLGDFFDCLGFLAIANQSTVRDAMVSIMLTSGPTQWRHHSMAPSSFQPLPWHEQRGLVGEDFDDTRQNYFGEISTNEHESCWSNALVVKGGTPRLPRDSSTCILWCAIALGALVRGHPLAQVGGYADLAEDSRACCDDATLDTARAHVAMAVLHNFMGDRIKSHEYLKIANSVVDGLPPEIIPRGFHGLLQYAGMAWTFETELASAEDVKDYWENADPIWELSDSVMERDICCLVLSVSVRMHQPFIDETGVNRVFFPEEPQPQPQPRPPFTKPVTSRPFMDKIEQQNAELAVGGSVGMLSPKVELEEVDLICLDNVRASAEMHKSLLPEMLRVQEWFESSKTDQGVGGLLYYGSLSYLQTLTKDAPTISFLRGVDVMLRYPGLCRYKSWLRIAHSHLYILALSHRRRKYEEMRASYNSVLLPGSKPAPPYEECRSMSDICDHPHCRRAAARMESILTDYWGSSKRTAP